MASSSAQLFIPHCESTQGPWIVRRASSPLGRYASQAMAIAAAEALAPGLSDSLGLPVEIHVQKPMARGKNTPTWSPGWWQASLRRPPGSTVTPERHGVRRR